VCKVRLIPDDAQAYGSPGTHLYQYSSTITITSKLKLLLPHGHDPSLEGQGAKFPLNRLIGAYSATYL
jgi:hypothetical protein